MTHHNPHHPPNAARYPLAAAKTLREREVDARSTELAASRTARLLAEAELARAQERRAAASAALNAAASAARARLEAGNERVFDLERAAEHARAERAELDRLSELVQRAEQELSAKRGLEQAALAALTAARAALAAIERHEEAFVAQAVRSAEEREEEASLERWNSKNFDRAAR